jgi:sugar/nucleoside kinase (ribokinase family)
VATKTVLVVGELNVDLILQGYRVFPAPGREVLVDDFVTTMGSASAICAMGLARLGTPVAFLSVVGADPWGDYCIAALQGAGVDVSRVRRDAGVKTGITVSIASPRDRALVSFPGSAWAVRSEDVGDAELSAFDHLHASSYFLQEGLRPGCADMFRRAQARGLSTSLDPGFDPQETWGRDLVDTLSAVDVFLPNEIELLGMTHERDAEAALRQLDNGRTRVVAKLGAEGCLTLESGRAIRVPAFAVNAVDTTGAGDSFDAGFLHAWLAGRPLVECLRWGAACGSLSTRGLGGTGRQADSEEALHLVQSAP